MNPYIPTLVVRTRHAVAAVEMNGAPVGDASPDRHLALPLSDSGEYYIGIFPLSDDERRYYPVVRKLRFSNGVLQCEHSSDVEAYAWPGGIYEAVFGPGVFPTQPEAVFPYTIDQAELPDGCLATLYYENGLRLAVEDGMRLRYGAVLGEAQNGKLYPLQNGMLCATAGSPDIPGGELPEQYGTELIVLDKEYTELLHITGSAVGLENNNAIRFTRMDTLLMHERRQVYRLTDGKYIAEEPALGFFTHAPRHLLSTKEILRAFCESVRYGLWDEAFSYLSPGLAAGLTPQTVRDCMGGFTGIRAPYVNDDQMLGLCYPPKDGVIPVRVFTFAFDNEKIDNILEE